MNIQLHKYLISLLLLFSLTGCAEAEVVPDDLGAYYGFASMEVLKLDWDLGPPQVVDLNRDGLKDLVVINNGQARIELLLQRPDFDPEALPAPVEEDENINDIFGQEQQWRFVRASYPVDVEVEALKVVDLNGDQYVDLIYTSSDGLTLVLQQPQTTGTGVPPEPVWHEPEHIDLKGIRPSALALEVGDLNGDQQLDIVILRDKGFFYLTQQGEGRFNRAQRIETAVDQLRWVGIGDMDGDQRQDLVLLTTEKTDAPIVIRLQQSDGTLGPERHCAMPAPMSLAIEQLQPDKASVLLGVARRSGRLGLFTLAPVTREVSTFSVYPIPTTDEGEARAFAAADLNGDGLSDMVVTSPTQAQFVVLMGRPGQSLTPAKTYPGLKDMRKICPCCLQGDQRESLVVLSVEEKLIALSHYQGERLTFPQTLAIRGRPVAMEVADFDGDDQPDLIYISRSDEDYSDDYHLLWQSGLDPNQEVALELDQLEQEPANLLVGDIDHNGRPDVLILQDYGPLVLVRQQLDGTLVVQPQEDIQAGLVSDLDAHAVTLAPLGPNGQTALLAARGNFARALDFREPDGWRVIDQYQLPDRNLRVNLAGALNENKLVILDENEGKVFFLQPQDDGTYGLQDDLEIGGLHGRCMLTGTFSDPQRQDLLICSDQQLVMVKQNHGGRSLQQIAVFETEIEDGRLGPIAVDDMNHDGVPEVVTCEVDEHHVQMLAFDAEAHLNEAYTFKVFEQHRQQEQERYQGRRSDSGQPRALTTGDVTGDGKSDLILLVHDRIIIYPQD